MAETKTKRYLCIDGKVKSIGINRDINMPEKATQKISEMWVFLDQNNKAFRIQIYYVFLDEKGVLDNRPYELEMANLIEDLFKIGKTTAKLISFPHKVKPPEKNSQDVQLFADFFIRKEYGTIADFNILLQKFFEIRKRKKI